VSVTHSQTHDGMFMSTEWSVSCYFGWVGGCPEVLNVWPGCDLSSPHHAQRTDAFAAARSSAASHRAEDEHTCLCYLVLLYKYACVTNTLVLQIRWTCSSLESPHRSSMLGYSMKTVTSHTLHHYFNWPAVWDTIITSALLMPGPVIRVFSTSLWTLFVSAGGDCSDHRCWHHGVWSPQPASGCAGCCWIVPQPTWDLVSHILEYVVYQQQLAMFNIYLQLDIISQWQPSTAPVTFW